MRVSRAHDASLYGPGYPIVSQQGALANLAGTFAASGETTLIGVGMLGLVRRSRARA